jgi:hypothetical protein
LDNSNCVLGVNAFKNRHGYTSIDNIAFGANTLGSEASGVGLLGLTTGHNNIAIGTKSLNTLTDGYQNIAVGGYSGDSINDSIAQVWTDVSDNLLNSKLWNSVVYGKVTSTGLSRFVAVSGSDASVAVSDDGIRWSTAVRTNNSYTNITYGLDTINNVGRFVAVGSNLNTNGRAMYSLNGLSWTAATLPAGTSTGDWQAVTYGLVNGQSLFVACAGSNSGTAANIIMTSPDGINWTLQTAVSGLFYGITYGLVNGVGTFIANSYNNTLSIRSTNGVNWYSSTAISNSQWVDCAWGLINGTGIFVAISNAATNTIAVSNDGITWNTISGYNLRRIKYVTLENGIGLFVAVGASGISTSMYGISWNLYTSSTQMIGITYGLVNGIGTFVACSGSASNRFMYSRYVIPTLNGRENSNTYVGYNAGNTYKVSNMLTTWYSGKTSVANSSWRSIAYGTGQGVFVAVSSTTTNTNNVMYSYDGINWTTISPNPNISRWTNITYGTITSTGEGVFVAVIMSFLISF